MVGNYEICQMEILLVAATRFEIQPTIVLLEKAQGLVNGHIINVLITGVGQVNTTYQLTDALQNKKPQLIIQAGIAGAFINGLNLGETVMVAQDTFGDVGMEEKGRFTTLFDAGFAEKNEPPFTNGWLVNNHELINNSGLACAKAITVNKVSDSLSQRQQLLHHFAPEVESMEGAAFHFVCLHKKIPFLQVRTISNEVGERDKSKWVIKEAINNLNIEFKKLINQLT